jgi:hypothetical protein
MTPAGEPRDPATGHGPATRRRDTPRPPPVDITVSTRGHHAAQIQRGGHQDRPVPQLIPPDVVTPVPVTPLPLPALPAITSDPGLVIGVAGVSHAGRVRDQVVLDALGWAAGDRLTSTVLDCTIVLRRHPEGSQVINTRGQVFLSAATRTLLRIAHTDRVLLAAVPQRGLLIVHPCDAVGALLTRFYDALPQGPYTC